MRRLAQELHVAPGALYYHVKNKQQLLDSVGGLHSGSCPEVDVEGGWSRIRRLFVLR